MARIDINNWRQVICNSLRSRNKNEYENIKELICTYNRLFDKSEALRYETKQLSFQNEKLQEELHRKNQDGISPSSPSSLCSSSSVQLEQKIYKLQEEVTDLHRRRSENAQQLVELNHCLQDRDKLLISTQNKLAEKETELMLAKESLIAKDSKLQEVEDLNQLLRDEYQALNLICNSLEEKNKKLQEEIHELIERWMNLKAKDAERLNEENEAAIRKRQEMVEKNLKEACVEPRIVVEEDKYSTVSPICISSSLPSKPYLNFDGHEGEVNALMFSSKGRILASGGSDRRIKLWDITHGTVDGKGTLTGSNAGVNAIDFDSEESLILGASNDFACRVWTTCDLRLRHTLTGHSGKVMASKFLLESSKVVTGSHDRTLKIWDLRSRACTKTLFAGSSCNDIAVSDSQLTTIVSGHFDKTVKFWDVRHDESVATIEMQGRVTSLSLSFDNFYLLCSVRDDALKIIDLRMNSLCTTLTYEGFHIGADYCRATFSPDGAFAACGCNSGNIIIWNVNDGHMVKQLCEHSSCVLATTWHPNGNILASCDKNKKIIAWGDF